MLSKELRDNILVVAAVSGNRSISVQDLKILARKHHLSEEDLHFAKEFCEQNRITVYEEEAAEEGILEIDLESTEPVVQETAEGRDLALFINSLVFPKGSSGVTNFMWKSMSEMTLDEAKLIAYRYGFLDGTPHTLDETGKKFGITRERVRLIESEVLRRRWHIRSRKGLKDFSEG